MAIINQNIINLVLKRGTEEIIDEKVLTDKMNGGKVLRIKFGVDPTSPNLHLGRAVSLLRLRDFQELGHKIVLVIGDFTGVIGDTSDKDSERPMLTEESVRTNLKTYTEQIGKIIDLDKCEIHHNGEWLGQLKYNEICKQANIFSLNDFISRENIKKRLDNDKRVSLRELLYPLMQGYDSVAVKADLEIGGTDQRFNLLAGRDIQRYYKQEPQNIITVPLIEGLDGRKMSSSWGNTINVFDSPNDMYGKLMSLEDKLIIKYFILTTRVDVKTIGQYQKDLEAGSNPKYIKMKLAYEIVRFYHSEQEAKKAEEYFVKTFSKKETPSDLTGIRPTNYDIITVLIEANFSSSRADARRNIEQGGVKVNEKIVTDMKLLVNKGDVIQKGKRFFIKVH